MGSGDETWEDRAPAPPGRTTPRSGTALPRSGSPRRGMTTGPDPGHTPCVTTVAGAGRQRFAVIGWPGRWPTAVDWLLAAALTAGSVAVALFAPADPDHVGGAGAVAFAVAAGATVLWWRAWPVACLCVGSVLVTANSFAGHAVGGVQYPAWLALYSVMASEPGRRRRAAATALVAVVVLVWAALDRASVDADSIVGVSILFALSVLGGEFTRTRRALAEADRAQLVLAAAQEAAHREHAVLQERARLARELHDALGHAVNVMVMQAGVARHVFDDRPEFARDALGQIETVGRDALAELDGVLRVLRSADDDGADDPLADRSTPTLAGLDSLCERIRATGRQVELRREPVALTPGGERAAYRIVQEAVTNAARHGRQGPIEVGVSGAGDQVAIEIRNPVGGRMRPARAPGSTGRGLVNMRERARLEGGDLRAGPDGRGSFVVRATLPAAVPPL